MDNATIDLSAVNVPGASIRFTQAVRVVGRQSPFILVCYEENGYQPEYGLRLDLDKKAFLDHLSNPEADALIKGAASRITDFIISNKG